MFQEYTQKRSLFEVSTDEVAGSVSLSPSRLLLRGGGLTLMLQSRVLKVAVLIFKPMRRCVLGEQIMESIWEWRSLMLEGNWRVAVLSHLFVYYVVHQLHQSLPKCSSGLTPLHGLFAYLEDLYNKCCIL